MGGVARQSATWRPAGQRTPHLRKDLWEEAHEKEAILHPNAPCGQDLNDETVAELIERAQVYIFQRRIRVTNFFRDFDKQKCGRCTRSQFGRVLSSLFPTTVVTAEEVAMLAEYFMEDEHAQWQTVARHRDGVNFVKFCEVLDGVFGSSKLEKTPDAVPTPPGAGLVADFRPGAADDEARLGQIIQRCAALMRTRHIDKLWRCFEAVDRGGLMFPKRSGKVTPSHFMQHFPFMKDFSGQDIKLILQRYTEEGGGVNVKALTREIEQALETVDVTRRSTATFQPGVVRRQKSTPQRSASAAGLRPSTCPASIGALTVEKPPAGQRPLSAALKKSQSSSALQAALSAPRPSSAAFSNLTNSRRANEIKDTDTMAKVRAFLAERDIRIADRFLDYDRLRKGVCTMNQAFSIFTVAGLPLTSKDHDALLNMYHDEAGRFRYSEFCRDAAKTGAEAADGKPPFDKRSHRYPGGLDGEEATLLESVLDRLRKRVHERSMEIRTLFEDFRNMGGACPNGHVSRDQFSRIMSMLNLQLSMQELDVLSHRFGDAHDGNEFNYLEFCDMIDPRPPPAEPCLDLTVPPYVPFKPHHYFDTRGRVVPRGTLPGLAKK